MLHEEKTRGMRVTERRSGNRKMRSGSLGFSLIEILIVVAIAMTLMAFTLPMTADLMRVYRANAGVTAATTVIQSTRFLAIRDGIPYTITFSAANTTYQIANLPGGVGTAAVNVGNAVPVGPPGTTISAATTLQFLPNGTVSATAGALNFNMGYSTKTHTITVTRVGHVTVQ